VAGRHPFGLVCLEHGRHSCCMTCACTFLALPSLTPTPPWDHSLTCDVILVCACST
jgi:hypothetical protein